MAVGYAVDTGISFGASSLWSTVEQFNLLATVAIVETEHVVQRQSELAILGLVFCTNSRTCDDQSVLARGSRLREELALVGLRDAALRKHRTPYQNASDGIK